ncbi:MAG TPA: ABC transporter permease [Vicinamibacterales bacterium]|nr:ABC transporter permease [Vicinamibacterales bacterium]
MRVIVHAIRGLRRTPVAAVGMLLTLAITIAANVGAFSLVNSLVLRRLPVRDPHRLVTVSSDEAIRLGFPAGPGWSYGMWDRLRARAGVVESATAWIMRDVNLASTGEKQLASALVASGGIFRTLGLEVSLGRTFGDPDDVRGGGPDGPVAVIGDRFWQSHFNRAPDVIGRALVIEGVPYRIVGVLPAAFRSLETGRPVDLVLPLETEPLIARQASMIVSDRSLMLIILLRLREGQPVSAATGVLRAIQPEILGGARLPRFVEEPFTLVPAAEGPHGVTRARYGRAATTMLGLVVLIWLAACANIANLQVARMSARAAELATRRALGASRRQLIGMLVVEALVVVSVATAIGVLAGAWASRVAASEILSDSIDALDLSLDPTALAFIAVLVLLAATASGLIPALRVTGRGSSPLSALQIDTDRAGRRSVGSRSLVVLQLAISFVLVVGASQFMRTAAATSAAPLGYDAERLVVAAIDGPALEQSEDARRLRAAQLLDAIGAIPGVARAGVSTSIPGQSGLTIAFAGNGAPERRVRMTAVSPGWFATYGTRVVAGRDFTAADHAAAPGVAIVNRALATALSRAEPLVGQRVGDRDVVGVVEDQIAWGGFTPQGVPRGVSDPPAPTLYVPLAQYSVPGPPGASRVLVSLRVDDAGSRDLPAAVARAIASVDSRAGFTLRHLADDARMGLAHQRILGGLSAWLGVLGVIVAAVGLYSVVAQDLQRRRRELGVRLALGARPDRLTAGLVGRSAGLVLIGTLAGVAVALALAPIVTPLLYGVDARDPEVLMAAGAALAGIGIVAAWVPSTRVCRSPPATLLRAS